jgi:hypothetical protein
MKKTRYILIIFIFLTTTVFGQVDKSKNYFPIWTFHQNNINIHGISVGIASLNDNHPHNTNTNGIKIELIGLGIILPLAPISPIYENDSLFNKMLSKKRSEKINGIVLSASGTVSDCLTNGISLGFIAQLNSQINGFSSSMLINATQMHNGLQTCLMFNETYKMNGIQFCFVSNSSFISNGVQISAVNISTKMNGIQIGLYNESHNLKGFQIGLFNVNQKRILPFINWCF